MTIERLVELYEKCYYSTFDFYVGVINLLVRNDDPDAVLEKIPVSLMDKVVKMAEEHYQSAGKHGDQEQQKNPEKIIRFWERHQ